LATRCSLDLSQPSPIRLTGLRREDLAWWFDEWGFTRGAEIGVYQALFTRVLVHANPRLHLLAVDPYEAYPEYTDMLASRMPNLPQVYERVKALVADWPVTLVRQRSADAAKDVPLNSLDFVYIDGNHAKDYVLEDLALWTDRVRPGGVIAGHDYHKFPKPPYSHIKVMRAVNHWVRRRHIAPWFLLDCDSYFWVKA